MGVYSNLALEKINEQSAIENCEPNSLLEFAVDIQRADHAMFNSILESDFQEAYVNNGVVLLTEAEVKEGEDAAKKKAASRTVTTPPTSRTVTEQQKIVELLKKLVEKIKSAIESFIIKAEQFFAKNKVHGKALTVENIKEKFKDSMDVKIKWVQDDETNWVMDIVKANNTAGGKSAEEAVEAMKGAYDKLEEEFKNLHKEGTIAEFLNDRNISIDKISKNILQGKFEQIRNLRESAKELENSINKDIANYAAIKDSADSSEEDKASASNSWTRYNAFGTYVTKTVALRMKYIKEKMSADRALFTKFSLKEKAVKPAEDKKEEAEKESCVYYNTKDELLEATEAQFFAIDMLNENYTISIFGD